MSSSRPRPRVGKIRARLLDTHQLLGTLIDTITAPEIPQQQGFYAVRLPSHVVGDLPLLSAIMQR